MFDFYSLLPDRELESRQLQPRCSQAVTHPSTHRARCCLISLLPTTTSEAAHAQSDLAILCTLRRYHILPYNAISCSTLPSLIPVPIPTPTPNLHLHLHFPCLALSLPIPVPLSLPISTPKPASLALAFLPALLLSEHHLSAIPTTLNARRRCLLL